MGMIKNEVTKVNYTLTLTEAEHDILQNVLYKMVLHEVKKKAEEAGVEWYDQTPDYFLMPSHPLHWLFTQFDIYGHINSWALSLKLY